MKHVKIWLANKNSLRKPLGVLNELRLIRHQQRFNSEDDTLYLISNYDTECNDKEQVRIKKFCNTHHIHLISLGDIKNEILHIKNEQDRIYQLSLFDLYMQEEITSEVSCLAAASDILRTLSPVAALGVYSDLDVELKKNSTETIKNDFLYEGDLETTSAPKDSGFDFYLKLGTRLNNSILYCDEEKSLLLYHLRIQILKNYLNSNDFVAYLKNISAAPIALKIRGNKEYFAEKLKEMGSYAEANNLMKLPATELRQHIKNNFDEENYNFFLVSQILYNSGPIALFYAIANALAESKLDKRQLTENSLFHYSIFSIQKETSYSCGDSDATWKGFSKILKKEEGLDKAVKIITRFFRNYKKSTDTPSIKEAPLTNAPYLEVSVPGIS